MATPLDSLANVKLHLGVTGTGDDAILEQLRTAASDTIARYCGRAFDGGSFTELFDGGARLLVLANYPVLPGTEIRVDPGRFFAVESILPAERYVVRADRGLVTLAAGGPFVAGASINAYPQAVRVTYSTATSAVPESVIRANAELIGHWFRMAKTWTATGQQNVLTMTNGGVVTEYPWSQSGGYDLPRGVKVLLEPFRTPVL
jgi:hypothetical protein